MKQNYWEAEDKKYIWHPAMLMKDNEVFPPVVIDHAKGSYLYGTDGKEYLDIISSWWCNLLGHCNEEINEALKKQVDELEQNRAPGEITAFSQKISLQTIDRVVMINPVQEIVFICTEKSDCSLFYTTKGIITSKITRRDSESLLEPVGFFRTHKGYIVNLSTIQEIHPQDNGTLLLLSLIHI